MTALDWPDQDKDENAEGEGEDGEEGEKEGTVHGGVLSQKTFERYLGGGNSNIFIFTKVGKMIHFD